MLEGQRSKANSDLEQFKQSQKDITAKDFITLQYDAQATFRCAVFLFTTLSFDRESLKARLEEDKQGLIKEEEKIHGETLRYVRAKLFLRLSCIWLSRTYGVAFCVCADMNPA